jgi:hypothetical protein
MGSADARCDRRLGRCAMPWARPMRDAVGSADARCRGLGRCVMPWARPMRGAMGSADARCHGLGRSFGLRGEVEERGAAVEERGAEADHRGPTFLHLESAPLHLGPHSSNWTVLDDENSRAACAPDARCSRAGGRRC